MISLSFGCCYEVRDDQLVCVKGGGGGMQQHSLCKAEGKQKIQAAIFPPMHLPTAIHYIPLSLQLLKIQHQVSSSIDVGGQMNCS